MSALQVSTHQPLGLVIVIPAYREPDILGVLHSLAACPAPACGVAVVVVLNAPANADAETLALHAARRSELQAWPNAEAPFALQLIDVPDLPVKHAGVGLARKLGMDWAADQLLLAGRPDGVIVNLDADCTVAPNYLQAIVQHFAAHPASPGASLYYEHPLSGALEPGVYQGIVYYELFLRYYVHALRYAGLPCAFQTVGSAMAVRASVYLAQGGMNRRKAGEDFYFLQKIIALGGFTEINSTCVYPSPRVSTRVPFGTGRAMANWLASEQTHYPADPLQGFLDLRQLCQTLPDHRADAATLQHWLKGLSPALRDCLQQQQIEAQLSKIQRHSGTQAAFTRHFFQWFNGFRVMKALHYLRDQAYGAPNLVTEVQRLLQLSTPGWTGSDDPQELLQTLRRQDRQNPL